MPEKPVLMLAKVLKVLRNRRYKGQREASRYKLKPMARVDLFSISVSAAQATREWLALSEEK